MPNKNGNPDQWEVPASETFYSPRKPELGQSSNNQHILAKPCNTYIFFLIPQGSSLIPQFLSICFSMFRLLTLHLYRQRIAIPVAFYLAVTHQRPSQAYRFFPHPGLKLWKLLWPEHTAGERPCYWKGFGRICISGLRGRGGKSNRNVNFFLPVLVQEDGGWQTL